MSKNTAGYYEEPPPSVIDQYEQRGDGKWYLREDGSSEFSQFIRNATPEEKAEVFERVMTEANAEQETVMVRGSSVPIKDFEPKMNPKYVQAQKDGKIRMECLATSVLASEARVLAHGADKYGARNWRKDEILASTYEGAMMRHLFAWINGEDLDPDSGEPHLSHLRACAAVVMDADMFNKLVDDRNRMESKGE